MNLPLVLYSVVIPPQHLISKANNPTEGIKMKKRLSEQQEFEIMKLILDKFLWLGFIVMGFGMYQMFANSIPIGLVWIVSGAILLILFMILIVKEYEVIR